MKKLDLTGNRYGRLLVLRQASRPAGRKGVWWECACDCGEPKIVRGHDLVNGNCHSCGCLRRELGAIRGRASRKHGMEGTPEYDAWWAAKDRCTNPEHKSWARYGGRGIRMHPEWMDSFAAFYAHIGPRPSPKHSLDRYPNNDGNYEPGNVRWATAIEQNNNKLQSRHVRRQRLVTAFDRTLNIRQWAQLLGIPEDRIQSRLSRGESPEQALRV